MTQASDGTRERYQYVTPATLPCDFLCWEMQLLSVSVQRGNAAMHRRSGLVVSCELGMRYDAGFAIPVVMS